MILQILAIGLMVGVGQNCEGPYAPPVITLNGYDTVTVLCNQPYVELGATAWSECEHDLSARVIVDNSEVDTTRPGTYTVYYEVTDNRGQTDLATRRVIIEDHFALTVNGFHFFDNDSGFYVTYWQCNRPYDDPGATAWDDCDGELSSQIIVSGAEDVLPGQVDETYLIGYFVQNSRGRQLTAVRAVVIVDYLEPAVSLLGPGEAPTIILGSEPDPAWWADCLVEYDRKYPSDPLHRWRLFDLFSRWRIDEKWDPDSSPYMWYCDRPSYIDPGAVSFDECEGPLDPDKILFMLTWYNTSSNQWVFDWVGFVGDFDREPPPPLRNGVQYRAYYASVDSSGNAPWGLGAQLFYFRSIRVRQIQALYAVSIVGAESDVEIECNTTFDPTLNVRAFSTCEGDITARMTVHAGDLDITQPGSYRARYEAIDAYGWLGWTQRNVDVVDRTSPVISLLNEGGTVTTLPVNVIPWCALRDNGDLWWENWFPLNPNRGWKVNDNCDDDAALTTNVTLFGHAELRGSLGFLAAIRNQSTEYPIDPTPYLRTYTLYHNVLDSSSNRAQPAYRFVQVVPTIPKIELLTPATKIIECGDAFDSSIAGLSSLVKLTDEPTVAGVDACEIALDPEFLTITGTVNPDIVGSYPIHYYVINQLGLSAEATITIRVMDRVKPVVTITPRGTYVIDPYLEWPRNRPFNPDVVVRVRANDQCDGLLAVELTSSGGMNFARPDRGTYRLIYSAKDSANNVGTATLTVVVDTQVEERYPEITLNGPDQVTLECPGAFTDEGATASDEEDGDLTDEIQVTGRVNTYIAGNYELTYTVTNSADNSASATRTVIVEDNQKPVMALRGATVMTVLLNDRFIDPGVTVEDSCDGIIEGMVTGAVNTARKGEYVLNYTAQDKAGNRADPLSRTVKVVDPNEGKEEGEEVEGEGELEGELEGEIEGEAPPDCGNIAGCCCCRSDIPLRDQIERVLGDYLIVGLGLVMLVAWKYSRRLY